MPRLAVQVDGQRYDVIPGTGLEELRTLLPPETQHALLNGLARFVDRFGHEVGGDAGLYDGLQLFVVYYA
ncbi:MAG TPA: hypothetical protein V6D47_15750 [Oscillatoriaceae cyanobacterium]